MINGDGDPLLGKETTTNLGVVKIGIEVAAVYSVSKKIGTILQEKHLQWSWKAERQSGQAPLRSKREAQS